MYATFEHVDVLSDANGDPSGLYYVPTYNEISYELPATTSVFKNLFANNPMLEFSITEPTAYPNGEKVMLPVGNFSGEGLPTTVVPPNAVEFLYDGLTKYRIPVTQPATTNVDVAAVNAHVLATMKSLEGFDANFIWQYYQLKGVQAVPTSDDAVNDFYLANIFTESSQPSVQLFRGAFNNSSNKYTGIRNAINVVDPMQDMQGFSHGGCLGCHGVAQTKEQDFSFLFFSKGKGFSPDPGIPVGLEYSKP